MKKFLCLFVGLILVTSLCMSDTITGTLRVTPGLSHTGSGATTLTESISTLMSWNIDTNAATQLTKLWVKQITLAGAASTNIDLYGSLSDSFGQSVSFQKVKFLSVIAASSNSASIGIGGAGANAWTNWVADATDVINVAPSAGFFLFAPNTNGYAVTNAVSDILSITNNHATNNAYVDIYISGIGI